MIGLYPHDIKKLCGGSMVQTLKSAFVSLVVEPSHRYDLRDCPLSFTPTDVNQDVNGAADVCHNRPVR
jgi:hypothetical protein